MSPTPTPRRESMRHRRPWDRVRVLGATILIALAAAACSSSPSASPTPKPVRTGRHGTSRHTSKGLTGTVTRVSATNLVLTNHGRTRTVALSSATIYRQNASVVNQSALRPGEHVRVRLASHTANATAKAVLVLPGSLSGVISGLSPQGFTLTAPNGTVTAVTTSPNTTFHQRAKVVGAGALTTGDTVRVQGQAATSGAFAATKVVIRSTGG